MMPISRFVIAFGIALACTACSRGADQEQLRTDLQTRLNRDVKPGLFTVVSLRREGSAPVPPGDSKAARVVVYYNATLRLGEDSGFGGWDQLAPSSVAFALGATERGIFGLQGEHHGGDLVRAYGSAVYEQTDKGWTPVAAAPMAAAGKPDIENAGTAPPSQSKQLIDRLAAMVNLPPPGVEPQQDEIIADELARASENIERRVQRRQQTFTIATGPEGSDYARFGDALIAAIAETAPSVKLRQRYSEGGVENATLLARGDADYALVQGDVAAAAAGGIDVFARGAPLETLRAVGALFADAIHVVVLADSPIRDLGQLRGRRVGIGRTSSGSRFDAIAVLAAVGLKPADLTASEDDTDTAIGRLAKRQLDAVFVTAPAPTRVLQQLAAGTPGLRLLPIKGTALDRVLLARPGLNALTLPPNTYPKQKEPVMTVASATLLVTTAEAPAGEVGRVSQLVFSRLKQAPARSAAVIRASAENDLRRVTIPVHPGATQPE